MEKYLNLGFLLYWDLRWDTVVATAERISALIIVFHRMIVAFAAFLTSQLNLNWIRYVFGETAAVIASIAAHRLLLFVFGGLGHVDGQLIKVLLELVLLEIGSDILSLTARNALNLLEMV